MTGTAEQRPSKETILAPVMAAASTTMVAGATDTPMSGPAIM